MSVKDRITELCKKNGISANKLEKELVFATGYISKLDKSTPNTKRIQKIADYFNVSLDYLMTGEEPELKEYSPEMAHLVGQIRNDTEISKALLKYFGLSDVKKKHIVELINLLSEA